MRPDVAVSIVIPAYYSHAGLGACLDALHAQTRSDFEVIVVNSSPEEDTRGVVVRHAPAALFVQSPARLLPHAARNLGVEHARGRLLVFTDPDCRAAPDWLERLTAACEAHHGAAGGSIVVEATGWLDVGMHLAKFPFQARGLPAGPTRMLPTANACYTRALWERIGPFDGALYCGDSLLSEAADRVGATPFFEPGAVVVHAGTMAPSRFVRERFVRGREYARVRLRARPASRARNAARGVLTFVLLVPYSIAVVRSAARGPELTRVLTTLPVQIAAQLFWRAGEAAAYVSAALDL